MMEIAKEGPEGMLRVRASGRVPGQDYETDLHDESSRLDDDDFAGATAWPLR